MNTTTTTANSLIDEIRNGDHDADLATLESAIRRRREILKPPIRIGDTVVFNHNARPEYLQGVRGKVTKVNPKSVVVSIGADGGRFAHSEPRAPRAIVDRVDD